MSQDVYVIAEHLQGKLADITYEMLGKARELANLTGGRLVSILLGRDVRNLAEQMGVADTVLYLDDERLNGFNPEAHQFVLADLIRTNPPGLTMIGYTSLGLDLAASLSAKLDIPLISYCKDLQFEDGTLVATSQLYGGKMFVETEVETGAIASILPGAFQAEAGMAEQAATVEDVALTVSLDETGMQFERLIEPEAGDVDLTQVPILVAVGRGIQQEDNLPLMEDLAKALGGAVAASRPVVDQGWLPMTRQVGKSGLTVKPRLYLALGISGAPEHVEGMKDAELIIAVNTDPDAPIFDVAHYGVPEDLFDVVTALTEKLTEYATHE